jgi:hypothetical protein
MVPGNLDRIARGKRKEKSMKRYLVIMAVLAALALPALVVAEEVGGALGVTAAPGERGWVDATELTNLLVEKRLITPGERARLTRPLAAPAVGQKRWEGMFEAEGYRGD